MQRPLTQVLAAKAFFEKLEDRMKKFFFNVLALLMTLFCTTTPLTAQEKVPPGEVIPKMFPTSAEIIGGRIAVAGEGINTGRFYQYQTGVVSSATLLNNNLAVITAHSLCGITPNGGSFVWGDRNSREVEFTEQTTQLITYTVHPKFKCGVAGAYDVAVVLIASVEYNSAVGPTFLSTRTISEAISFQSFGFGRIAKDGPPSEQLKVANMKLVSVYTTDALGPTLLYEGIDGDPYRGDSGGPITCRFPRDYNLYMCGTNSAIGENDQGKIFIFSPDISQYVDFILQSATNFGVLVELRAPFTNAAFVPIAIR